MALDTFEAHPLHYTRVSDKKEFPIGAFLGRGTFGDVYKSADGTILKIIRLRNAKQSKAIVTEATLQQKLHEKEPDVCPAIYAFGTVVDRPLTYVLVMEEYDGTARQLLERNHTPALALDWMHQIATILGRLEPYKFNHRDLKSDNMMYRKRPDGGYTFVLIDFGFACATFDGVNYTGTLYFSPRTTCFRRSRDLGMMVAELYRYFGAYYSETFRAFLQSLLTFKLGRRTCILYDDCPPDHPTEWGDMYDFFNKAKVENPNTTPEGLLHAIEAYKAKEYPAPPAPPAPPASPGPAPASPAADPLAVVDLRPVKPCPPGKERNPTTGRCRNKTRKTPACPSGKVRNPATRRCVKRDGAIGKKLG